MNWLVANWLWIVIGVAFVLFHIYGHGSHGAKGGHGGRSGELAEDDQVASRSAKDQNETHDHKA